MRDGFAHSLVGGGTAVEDVSVEGGVNTTSLPVKAIEILREIYELYTLIRSSEICVVEQFMSHLSKAFHTIEATEIK